MRPNDGSDSTLGENVYGTCWKTVGFCPQRLEVGESPLLGYTNLMANVNK